MTPLDHIQLAVSCNVEPKEKKDQKSAGGDVLPYLIAVFIVIGISAVGAFASSINDSPLVIIKRLFEKIKIYLGILPSERTLKAIQENMLKVFPEMTSPKLKPNIYRFAEEFLAKGFTNLEHINHIPALADEIAKIKKDGKIKHLLRQSHVKAFGDIIYKAFVMTVYSDTNEMDREEVKSLIEGSRLVNPEIDMDITLEWIQEVVYRIYFSVAASVVDFIGETTISGNSERDNIVKEVYEMAAPCTLELYCYMMTKGYPYSGPSHSIFLDMKEFKKKLGISE